MSNSFGESMKKNIIYAYSAQAISMVIGVIYTLLLPKILGVEGYGYWQLLLLYISYIGIAYLGLNDGLYLKNGGKKFDELNFSSIKSQVILFLIIHVILSMIFIFLINVYVGDLNKRAVLTIVSLYLPIFNMKGLLDQQFQATNKIHIHSISTIIDKILMILIIAILVILDITNYQIYSILYIFCGFVALTYIIMNSKKIFSSKFINFNEVLKESIINIRNGFPLMLSSFVSMLIIGISRQLIEIKWGIAAFSVISLSMSLLNLFLVFVTKSGMVLFPSIRILSEENRRKWYKNVLSLMNVILPLVFLGYFPLSLFINFWLPNYIDTIFYLGLLFPIVIFESKMTVLGTTFLKVYNKQKTLLIINMSIFLVNIIIAIVSTYIFENANYVVIGIVISLALRSHISESIVNKGFGIKNKVKSTMLIVFSVLFITFNYTENLYFKGALYLIIVVYVVLNIKVLRKNYFNLKEINAVEIN